MIVELLESGSQHWPHIVRQHPLPGFVRMDHIGQIEGRISGHTGQEKWHQLGVIAPRNSFEHLPERADVIIVRLPLFTGLICSFTS